MRTCTAILAVGLCAAGEPASAKAKFIIIDPPESIGTHVNGINADGSVVGDYEDSKFTTRGFVEAPDGTITIFAYNGSQNTKGSSINRKGEITGTWYDSGITHGLAGTAKGKLSTFDPPDSSYINGIPGINDKGSIAGYYSDYNGRFHGFVRSVGGNVKAFDPKGANNTYVGGINNAGTICGVFDGAASSHGFIRAANGKITRFDPPGGIGGLGWTRVADINDAGAITGTCNGCYQGVSGGYIRDPQGNYETFGVKQGVNGNTHPEVINANGVIAGEYGHSQFYSHGFVRAANGTITKFDPAQHAIGTTVTGINAAGALVGFYSDINGVKHGFLRTP